MAFVTSGSFQLFLSSVDDQTKQTPEQIQDIVGAAYTGLILWIVAGMAAFRFVGSLLYLVLRCF